VIEMLKRMIIISIYRLTIMSCTFSFEKKNASQYSYMYADGYISSSYKKVFF
jgi:hypothetical protein